jgi:hypothetical protein
MKSSHNKKRNVGIVYELLLRHVSSMLIEENRKNAQKALDIIEKYFNENTELYKEFRLFNALAKSTVSDTPIAAAVLTEAKSAARRCNVKSLNREKSMLIKEINYKINDSQFYHRRIPEYTVYATIQSLLNEWRKNDLSDLSKIVDYESKIVRWLLEEKVNENIDDQVDPNIDKLVVKILTEKFNKKYDKTLNTEQKDIVRSYVFSMSYDEGRSIYKKLNEIKDRTVYELDKFRKETDSQVILEKIGEVKQRISNIDLGKIDDQSISRFLLVSRLKDELLEER